MADKKTDLYGEDDFIFDIDPQVSVMPIEEDTEMSHIPDGWEAPVSDQSLEGGTNRPDLLKEEYDKAVRKDIKPADYFTAFTKYGTYPDDYLIINDVHLTNVPTTSINISGKSDVFVSETLRTPAPVVTSKGKQDIVLRITLNFKPGEAQQNKLRRIIATISKNPFVFIYNNKIKRTLGFQENENSIFVLETGNLRNSSESVGLIILDLTFHLFNYKPFSNHFYYNTKLGKALQKEETDKDQTSESFIELDFDGYEPNEFSLTKNAEVAQKRIENSLSVLSQTLNSENVPVSMPSQSEAWMYYADKLSGSEYIPHLVSNPSDYVGFSVKDYQYFSPPAEARQGEDFTSIASPADFKPHVYPYKATDETIKTFQEKNRAILTGQTTTTEKKQNTYSSRAIATRTDLVTKLRNTKSGKSLKINLLAPNREPSADAAIEISKLWRTGNYDNTETKTISLGLVGKLAAIAEKFPGKTIKLISVIRHKDQRLNKKNPQNKTSNSPHARGVAADIVIEGVEAEDLVKAARSIPNTGVGYYPNTTPKFVHVDSRGYDYCWIDVSKNGEAKKKPSKNDLPKYEALIGPLDPDVFNLSFSSEIEDDKEEVEEELKNYKSPLPEDDEINRKIDQKKAKQNTKDKPTERQKSEAARKAWIQSLEDNGWKYYDEDPAVRNIFYKTYSATVSGNKFSQERQISERDIVCSAISLTFGHRLAPIKLLGQNAYSYQFLGAGNKTGQLVFTYSGNSGTVSADHIHQLISMARRSANNFGSVIPDAGSVGISHLSFKTNEQNTILALLNPENVIVTNIEHIHAPEGSNKHQLLIEFIVQDFQEEDNLDKQFVTSLDSKKKIIKYLMSYLESKGTAKGTFDFRTIIPTSNIATSYSGAGLPYRAVAPSWVAEAVVTAASICSDINNRMPPSSWKVSKGSSRTWKDNYAEWGAERILFGRVKNIDSSERNANEQSKATSYIARYYSGNNNISPQTRYTYEEMYQGKFEHDGGEDTNDIHEDLFDEWIARMDEVVKFVNKYIGEGIVFENYFGSTGKERLEQITRGMGECYKDMFLPDVPGTKVPLPPEYYIYDDSFEDPLISSTTNQENMEKLLKQHAEREFESIKHYMRDCFLGGSYVSQNLPRILENRKLNDENFFNEITWLDSWAQLFSEGTTVWEPIYYRDDPAFSGSKTVLDWQSSVKNYLGNGDDSTQRLKFMDNLVSLSPYLNKSRQWKSPPDRQTVIESLYGQAWNKINFGPNPKYTTVDTIWSGNPVPNATLAFRELVTEEQAKQVAKLKGTNIQLSDNKVVTTDNAVTVSSLEAEKQEEKEEKGLLDEIGDIAGQTLINSLSIPTMVIGTIKKVFGLDSFNKNFERQLVGAKQLADLRQNQLRHPTGKNVDEGKRADSLAKLASNISLGEKRNDLSFRRAFPTFKIYFIEDDSNETESVHGTVVRAFDDFYSYSAIQEIKVTRSRKIAADLAVIRMTNVGGKLFRKRYGYDPTEYKDSERQGIFADTELENPFEKMVLQDGVKVQIRLGYANSSENLETVFLGQIVETSLSNDSKIVEIMCQGYGAELETVELGPLEDGPLFYSTQQALSAAIIQDSIANFGRQSKFGVFNPAEMRHAFTGGEGKGFFGSDLFSKWVNDQWDRKLAKYSFLNYPQDDNIFAPPPQIYTSMTNRIWNNACLYRPIKQTPWQIFKEHELRHPGYVAMAVPYGHSPRMTMFFGAKTQHYWCRPPSSLEIELATNASKQVQELRGLKTDPNISLYVNQKIKDISKESNELAEAFLHDMVLSYSAPALGRYIGQQFGRYVPFRNYHYLDSNHHIIKNEIRTSIDGTFNEVEINYFDDENAVQEMDTEDFVKSLTNLKNNAEGVYSVKLDQNIPEEALRCYRDEFPSCVTDVMAKRYAQGIFIRHLKDAYKGELTILGKETIKPLDILFLNDTTSQMTGPVEVESVTHIFNRDVGFVSVITPDLCVEANDVFSASNMDVIAAGLNLTWGTGEIIGAGGAAATGALATASLVAGGALSIGATAALAGFGVLGAYAGLKFVSWTQEGTPVMITPLTLGGKPFISGSLGTKKTSMFTNIFGKWNQYWDDVESAWNKADISEAIADLRIDVGTKILGLFGPNLKGE